MKALLSRAMLWTLMLAGFAWAPAPAHAQVRYGSIVVLMSLAISTVYLWLRYL